MFINKNVFLESLTKNLVTFNFDILGFHWKIWVLRRKGVHKLKGEVGQFGDLRGERDEAWQKRWHVFCPVLEDRVHAMTLLNLETPKQKNKKKQKPGNDCMTGEILQKRYSNEWLQTQDLREKKVLEKVQIGLRWC